MDTVTIKIDKKIKQAAVKEARRRGISVPKLLSFKIKEEFEAKERLNAKTRGELLQVTKEAKKGKNVTRFDNINDAIAYLKHA